MFAESSGVLDMKYLSYALVALFITVSALALTYYVRSSHQDMVIQALGNTVADQQIALDTIETSVKTSDRIIKSLSVSVKQVDQRGGVINRRVDQLEKNNAEIRNLLAVRLPANGCMLDDTCEVSVSGAKPSPASPVPAAPTSTKR